MPNVMSENQRTALHRARTTLVKDMHTSELLDHLISSEIFTDDDEERVLNEATSNDKNRKLLDLLRTKPSGAFPTFIESLEEIGQSHLAELVMRESYSGRGKTRNRSLSEIGKVLISGGVPCKPDVFIDRPELSQKITAALKEITSDRPGWVLVHGMGGCGKTTIVANALRDPALIDLYPGAVVWFKIGQLRSSEDLLVKMNNLLVRLAVEGNAVVQSTNLEEAETKLRIALVNDRPNTLLVVDDLWDDQKVKHFNVGGHILVTSRDANILARVQGKVKKVKIPEGFSEDQTAQMFSRTLDKPKDNLPDEAVELGTLCGGSPLAISIFASLLKERPNRWKYYLRLLRERRLDRIRHKSSYEFDTIYDAMDISIDDLRSDLREQYMKLAVFPRGVMVNSDVLATLWQLEVEEAEDDISELISKSLAWYEWNEKEGCDMYGIHDLQSNLLRNLIDKKDGAKKELHRELLNSYLNKGDDRKWANLRNDGYIFWFIGFHMVNAGMKEELTTLLTDLEFVQATINVTGPMIHINNLMMYKEHFEQFNCGDKRNNYLSFLKRNANLLVGNEHDQDKVVQLGLSQSPDTDIFKEAFSLAEKKSNDNKLFWRWRNSEMAPSNVIISAPVGHSDVCSIDTSRSGNMAVACNRDGMVYLLSIKTGRTLFEYKVDDCEISHVCFINDDSRFICCSDNGYIRIFEVPKSIPKTAISPCDGPDSLELCWHWNNHHANIQQQSKGSPNSHLIADFHPNSSGNRSPRCLCVVGADRIFVGYHDGCLGRLRIQDDSIYMSSEFFPHKDAITSVAASDCGMFVITGSVDRRARVFDLDDLEFLDPYQGHKGSVTACLMVPGEASNAVTASGNEIHVWNIRSGELQYALVGRSNSFILSLAISKDARWLAAGMVNNKIALWRMSTQKLMIELSDIKGYPNSLSFFNSDCKDCLLSTSGDNSVTSWNLTATSVMEETQVKLQVKPVFAVHWRDAAWLAAVQDQNSGKLLIVGDQSFNVLHASQDLPWEVRRMVFTEDGRKLALGFEEGGVARYDLHWNEGGGLEMESLAMWWADSAMEGGVRVTAMIYADLEGRLVVGLDDGHVWLLTSDGESKLMGRHEDSVTELKRFHNYVLSASSDRHVRHWDLSEGKSRIVCEASDTIHSMDVLPERRWFLTALSNKRVELWEMDANGSAHQLCAFSEHEDSVRVARFCPADPGLVASVDDRGTVHVWRAPQGISVKALDRPSTDTEYWTRDLIWCGHTRLLTVSPYLRAWDVRGSILQTFHPRGSEVHQVSVRPGAEFDQVIAVDSTGTLYLLDRVKC